MTDTTDDMWTEISFVIKSQYRVAVLERLMDGPATPSTIALETDIALSHVSRALIELRKRSLVELLVPDDQKKGRIYGITETGEDVWKRIDDEQIA